MTIFVSSVQKEFAEERKAIKAFVSGDHLLRRFFNVFLFEDLPAEDRRPDDAYIERVERCSIYLGLYGDSYGSEGADGLSPTEREFDRATAATRPRLTFIKASADISRHPKMTSLVQRAEGQLTRRRFSSRPHASVPHNPLIAEPLFLTRLVERAGTGILDMIALCKESGLKSPVFRQDAGSFVQTLWRPSVAVPIAGQAIGAGQVTAQVVASHNALKDILIEELSNALRIPVAQVTAQVTAQVVEVLSAAMISPKTHEELLSAARVKHREHFRKAYVEPLVKSGWIERTIPDKPTSRFQKYRTAEHGQSWLARYSESGKTGKA
jgi:hypothetical protein